MNRFAELLDRLAYEPGPQQQAAPDHELLSQYRRSQIAAMRSRR